MSYWFATDCKLEKQLRKVVNIYYKTSSLPTFPSDSQSTSDAKGNDFCLVVVIFNSQKSVNISYLLCYVSIFVYFEIFTSFFRLFSEISSVFKSWITRVYLIQTALCAHTKKKSKATVYEKIRSLWFHVFSTRIFVKSGYSYIPEFSIETSSINAVFAQITVKS